eukprot:GFYU01005015.1.p1 GENE.GFYU01005015.1~~GFYU01005015.1.p1  ORF type:complete len:976 (-),score=230.34 GFYU01005015.1:49-2976(-)
MQQHHKKMLSGLDQSVNQYFTLMESSAQTKNEVKIGPSTQDTRSTRGSVYVGGETVQFTNNTGTVQKDVSIVNGTDVPVFIVGIKAFPKDSQFSLSDEFQWAAVAVRTRHNYILRIPPDTAYTLAVSFSPTSEQNGFFSQELCFVIASETSVEMSGLVFARAHALVLPSSDMKTLLSAEAEPFVPASHRELFDKKPVRRLLGMPPTRCSVESLCSDDDTLNEIDLQLEDVVADSLAEDVDDNDPNNVTSADQLARSHSSVTEDRALRHNMLKALQLEMKQMQEDIHSFDLHNALLRPPRGQKEGASGMFLVTIPGLLEKKPQVQYGDQVIIRCLAHENGFPMDVAAAASLDDTEWIGFVHNVSRSDILISLHPSFISSYTTTYSGGEYLCHLRFCFSHDIFNSLGTAVLDVYTPEGRCRLQRWESAASMETQVVDGATTCPCETQSECECNDSIVNELEGKGFTMHAELQLNRLQLEAVKNIVTSSTTGFPPYIVHGPPGTGKTAVIVSAAAILMKAGHRVLIATPSNTAADVITRRLAQFMEPSELLRLQRDQRALATVPEDVQPYCHSIDIAGADPSQSRRLPRVFVCPGRKQLAKYSIVVCTCAASVLLVKAGLPKGHFSHILVDEAGQSLQPECLLPLQLATRDTTIAFVGDHKQLGPVVRSRTARRLGLGISLLERFMTLYERDYGSMDERTSSQRYLTLCNNYRAHEALLQFPSDRFYNSSLIQSAANVDGLCDWEELPNRLNCPLMFYGVAGVHRRDLDSPSFYNPVEASTLVNLLSKLLDTKRATVDDIGVIAPYRQQVYKIRLLLRHRNLGKIRVGTVDDYQGQEEKIVFISTVISREGLSQKRLRDMPGVGLISNNQRFNVAVTRAKALMVIVGDPLAMVEDDNWGALLKHCVQKNAYCGCPCPELDVDNDLDEGASPEEVTEDAITRMSRLLLGPGDYDRMYPGDDQLEAFYRDEQEFRIIGSA